jgi:hypothetical protein
LSDAILEGRLLLLAQTGAVSGIPTARQRGDVLV